MNCFICLFSAAVYSTICWYFFISPSIHFYFPVAHTKCRGMLCMPHADLGGANMNKRPEHKNECKDAPLPTITNDSMAAGSPHPPFGQKPSPEEIWKKIKKERVSPFPFCLFPIFSVLLKNGILGQMETADFFKTAPLKKGPAICIKRQKPIMAAQFLQQYFEKKSSGSLPGRRFCPAPTSA